MENSEKETYRFARDAKGPKSDGMVPIRPQLRKVLRKQWVRLRPTRDKHGTNVQRHQLREQVEGRAEKRLVDRETGQNAEKHAHRVSKMLRNSANEM